MTEREAERRQWLSVIKGEYKEMPGLELTRAQITRLWGLEPAVCDELLETLQESHFLRVNPRGRYVLAGSEPRVAAPA